LLLGLPHNHSEDLQGQKTAAAPGNVRTAEEFMRANACMPLTITEIADAAGCGIRARQNRVPPLPRHDPDAGIATKPGWTRREQRYCGPTGLARWPGSPLHMASAIRPGSRASSRAGYGVSPSEILQTRRDTLAR
jgi:hypothetical protein